MSIQSGIDIIFRLVSQRRNTLVLLLNITNWLLFVVLCIGAYSIIVNDANASWFYRFARECGEYAILFFILVSIPGIARRFRYSHKLIMIIMMFRRQLGVLTYLFVLMHSMILRIIPWITKEIPLLVEPFILAGISANILLFSLFITSNNWSVKKLGNWWGKIHDLIYIIVWIIFLHTALQGLSTWSVLIGLAACLQLSSHLYARFR